MVAILGTVLPPFVILSVSARIIRDGIVVHEGKLASIQRGKDAVKEVRSGFECGLVMESYNDIKEGDQIESFIMEEVPR